MVKVLNKYRDIIGLEPINIMRPGPFGNPFEVGKDGNRNEVIWKYRCWVNRQPNLIEKIETELVGKDLVCCCAPKPCHGDVLLEIANRSKLWK